MSNGNGNGYDDDKYYEHFWITFKNVIYDIVSLEYKNIIYVYSNNMNNLKSIKEYDKILNLIEEFFNKYINGIVRFCFINTNELRYNILALVKINIDRWKQVRNISVANSIELSLLRAISKYIKNNRYYLENITNTISNAISTELTSEISLNKIMNIAIKYSAVSLIYELSNFTDITFYYKDNKDNKDNKNNKFINNEIKGNKILKYIEEKQLI
jgi:hypothetical protein